MPNPFDRIIKEAFYQPTISLMSSVLGVRNLEVVQMPTELHKTLEKKVDMLFKACPPIGPPFLLLIEWQTWNDPRMALRMLFYYCMLRARYPNIEIRTYVIYIGRRAMNMESHITGTGLDFRFELIDLGKYASDTFLASDIPEELLLSILADNDKKKAKRPVVQRVLIKLQELLKDDPGRLREKLVQLEVLGKLRDIQHIIIEEENKMALTYNLKTDIRYKQGVEQGLEQGLEQGRTEKDMVVVKNMLFKKRYSLREIADIAEVSLDFVKSLKVQLCL